MAAERGIERLVDGAHSTLAELPLNTIAAEQAGQLLMDRRRWGAGGNRGSR